MPNAPEDPMTALSASSTEIHEMFQSYVMVGFTETQAMQIILQILDTTMRIGAGGQT